MLFAIKGLFAKWLYARGVEFEALVTVRALLAMPLFWAVALLGDSRTVICNAPRAAVGAAACAGFLCYYVGALTDFYALTLIDASIERVLLFSYPALVVLINAVRQRRWPSARLAIALAITYAGIFLAVGGFQADVLRSNLLGACLVLISALTYAIYFLIGARYTHVLGSACFTLIAMTTAAAALVAHFAVLRSPAALASYDAGTWAGLAALATVCMFLPALMQAEGVKRVGAERAAIVSTAGPPTTILFAGALLGERLVATQLAGVACIIGGILVLELATHGRGKC